MSHNGWKESIIAQLSSRDQIQRKAFFTLIEQNDYLAKREKLLLADLLAMKQKADQPRVGVGSVGGVGPGAESELMVYKKLTETQEAFRGAEQKIATMQATIEGLEAAKKSAQESDADKAEIIASHASTILLLQGEVQALSLQVVQKEEESKQLIREKNSLLADITKKSFQNAELLNQMMTLEEKVKELTIKLASAPSAASATSSSTVHGELDLGAPVPSRCRKVLKDQGELNCVAYNPTGLILASAGVDKAIRLYDTSTISVKSTLQGATQSVMVTAFSADENLVLGSSNDNSTRIWHLPTQRLRHTLNGHTSKVYAGCFSSDSSKALTGSHDRTIKIWDLVRGYVLRTIMCSSSCNAICMNVDSTLAFSGHFDSNLRIWELKNGTLVTELSGIHTDQITSVSINQDSTAILTSSRDNSLKLIDITTHEVIQSYKHDEYRNGANWAKACLSPDGSYVAAGSADGQVFIWDAKSGKHHSTLKGHKDIVTCVAWNPQNNGSIASCDKSGAVFFWE
jgi:autophagy-related protein 16